MQPNTTNNASTSNKDILSEESIITFFICLNHWNEDEFQNMIPLNDIKCHLVSILVFLVYCPVFTKFSTRYNRDLPAQLTLSGETYSFKKYLLFTPFGQTSHLPIVSEPIKMISSVMNITFDLLEVANCFFGVCLPEIDVERTNYTGGPKNTSWSLQAQPYGNLHLWSSVDEDGNNKPFHIYPPPEKVDYTWPFVWTDIHGNIKTGDFVTIRIISVGKNKTNVEFLINKVKKCRIDDIPLPLCLMVSPLYKFECNYYVDHSF
jgi:hypothetical protein